jgi:Xaa-Pro dipeptidase
VAILRQIHRTGSAQVAYIESELSFPLVEYHARIEKIREEMRRRGLDVLLVHAFPHICYLSGFQSVNSTSYYCLVLPVEEAPSLVMWRDEQSNAKLNSWVTAAHTYVRRENPINVTLRAVAESKRRPTRVGIETESMYLSPAWYAELREGLSPATLVDASDIVPREMLIKSPREIEYIRRAGAMTVRGMRAAIQAAIVGDTDNDVAAAASQALYGAGSEFMCCEPIVCAGVNSGIPHGHFSGRRLNHGDTVLLEMAACLRRYSAPLMRTVSLGQPGTVPANMAAACRHTIEEVLTVLRPGVSFAEVASKGRVGIETAGPLMIFPGTYAYSIGLGFPPSWADCPVDVREHDPMVVRAGMVFHLPISLRDEGRYGVAFSETVAITDSGCEVLTNMERELFIR